MFSNENDTDDWELDLDLDNKTLINKEEYYALLAESNTLYALRKIGAVTVELEAEAIEFLREEGVDV